MKYLTQDVLGSIDNSHLAIADGDPEMAQCDKCLKLAELHADAVDFVKTGKEIKVPLKYKAKIFPDFMEMDNKPTYESKTILGYLYRDVIK
jgi:RNA-dependent RNA polymerase